MAAALKGRLKSRHRPIALARRFGLVAEQKPAVEVAKIIANAGQDAPSKRPVVDQLSALIEPVTPGPGDHVGRPQEALLGVGLRPTPGAIRVEVLGGALLRGLSERGARPPGSDDEDPNTKGPTAQNRHNDSETMQPIK